MKPTNPTEQAISQRQNRKIRMIWCRLNWIRTLPMKHDQLTWPLPIISSTTTSLDKISWSHTWCGTVATHGHWIMTTGRTMLRLSMTSFLYFLFILFLSMWFCWFNFFFFYLLTKRIYYCNWSVIRIVIWKLFSCIIPYEIIIRHITLKRSRLSTKWYTIKKVYSFTN